MCDHCVIDSVKSRMLSRRGLLGGGLAAAAAGIASPAFAQDAARPAAASTMPANSIADLTHELYPEFPTFFGDQQFFMEQKFSYAEHKFNLFELRVNETRRCISPPTASQWRRSPSTS